MTGLSINRTIFTGFDDFQTPYKGVWKSSTPYKLNKDHVGGCGSPFTSVKCEYHDLWCHGHGLSFFKPDTMAYVLIKQVYDYLKFM